MIQRLSQVLSYFPKQYADAVDKLSVVQQSELEEFRLRIGFPPTLLIGREEKQLNKDSVTGKVLEEILLQATGQAIYSAKEMLKKGFLTVPGGHRLGICGTAVYKGGEIAFLKDVSSINLRIASQRPGFSLPAVQYLWTHPDSALIIAPPGWGKTTLLRDLARKISNSRNGTVSVVDERGELFPTACGKFSFPVGKRMDVLSGCKKASGIEMMIRTMNPDWVAVDEITSHEDTKALIQAGWCGVSVLASAHAGSMREFMKRPVYKPLVQCGLFDYYLVMHDDKTWTMERLDLCISK